MQKRSEAWRRLSVACCNGKTGEERKGRGTGGSRGTVSQDARGCQNERMGVEVKTREKRKAASRKKGARCGGRRRGRVCEAFSFLFCLL